MFSCHLSGVRKNKTGRQDSLKAIWLILPIWQVSPEQLNLLFHKTTTGYFFFEHCTHESGTVPDKMTDGCMTDPANSKKWKPWIWHWTTVKGRRQLSGLPLPLLSHTHTHRQTHMLVHTGRQRGRHWANGGPVMCGQRIDVDRPHLLLLCCCCCWGTHNRWLKHNLLSPYPFLTFFSFCSPPFTNSSFPSLPVRPLYSPTSSVLLDARSGPSSVGRMAAWEWHQSDIKKD